MNHIVSTIGNLFRNKDKQALLHLTGTVYKLQCSCEKTYIGQSKRNLKTRLEEHDPITFRKSDVTDHLRENPDHTIRDVAAAPQTPQLGGAQANFRGPS